MIKPVHEEQFFSETLKNLESLHLENPDIKVDQCREVIGNIFKKSVIRISEKTLDQARQET